MEGLIQLAILVAFIWNLVSKLRKARRQAPPPPAPGESPFPDADEEGEYFEELPGWFPGDAAPESVAPPREAEVPEAPIEPQRPARTPRVVRPAPLAPAAPCAKRSLRARPDLQQAVVWAEILAPPLALRHGPER